MTKQFPYCPIFLDLEERPVVIVGGGAVCARKAEMLMRYGAQVTIVAPDVTAEIEAWERDGKLATKRKLYDEADLEGASMVIASTDDRCINARIARDSRRRHIPVNIVDVTHLCDFIVPAVIDKRSVQIAVSTGGQSPALARRLKADLNRVIGPEYGEVNDLLGSLRQAAKKALPTDADRKRFFDSILDAGILDLLRDDRRREAFALAARLCEGAGVAVSDWLRDRLRESKPT